MESTSVAVIDDARFSSAIIAKALREGGFSDVRLFDHPVRGVEALEARPADVLIVDWLMPEMDGMEVARRVKRHGEQGGHYTWIVVLSARDELDALREAFSNGVDDFVNKSEIRTQLVPRVHAGARVAEFCNRLMAQNRELAARVRELEAERDIDPLTGLGTRPAAERLLQSTLRQVEGRGGAGCVVCIGLTDLATLQREYPPAVCDALIGGVARRLCQLVRPLDTVFRIDTGTFAVVMLHADIENCTTGAFRRIHDALNQRSFKTENGFVPVQIAMSIVACDAGTGLPTPAALFDLAGETLLDAIDTGIVMSARWDGIQR